MEAIKPHTSYRNLSKIGVRLCGTLTPAQRGQLSSFQKLPPIARKNGRTAKLTESPFLTSITRLEADSIGGNHQQVYQKQCRPSVNHFSAMRILKVQIPVWKPKTCLTGQLVNPPLLYTTASMIFSGFPCFELTVSFDYPLNICESLTVFRLSLT